MSNVRKYEMTSCESEIRRLIYKFKQAEEKQTVV